MDFKKILVAVFALLLVAGTTFVAASNHKTDDFEIIDVEVDDISIFGADGSVLRDLSVERGEQIEVTVTIEALNGTDNINGQDGTEDVKIDVELEGAEAEGSELDDIEDETDFFDIINGKTYTKRLVLDIPDDIDSGEEFTLDVEVSGGNDEARFIAPLAIDTAKHDLQVEDVVFAGGRNVEAGDVLTFTVWLNNKGDTDEEDIKVFVDIPELGVSSEGFVDELVTHEKEDDTDREDRDDTVPVSFSLRIPKDAESGTYDLIIDAEFNRGKDTITSTEEITVSGIKGEEVTGPTVETIISVDTTSQSVKQGEGVVYKVSVANLGSEAKTFSTEVSGVSPWGSARVDPGFVTVAPGASADMFVFVSAAESATVGKHVFTATVKEGAATVKSLSLEADVSSAAVEEVAPALDQVRRGLEIGFAILLIILVILGIIIAISKIRKGREFEEEPSTAEGQGYYYYPRY